MINESWNKSKVIRYLFIFAFSIVVLVLVVAGITILRTLNRTIIQFDIHQDQEIIHLSTYAEPPQFAIWIENIETNHLQTVFVTYRVSTGDWEGKADVPVALPKWYNLFMGSGGLKDRGDDVAAITGATPQEDYFSIRAEVRPGSRWKCWIEVNLAGDYNEAFPEFDFETLTEDEFAQGQPAMLYSTEITAEEGLVFTPELVAQSVWEEGINRVEPVSEGVTTARDIFRDIKISVIRPKPMLINKYKIENNK